MEKHNPRNERLRHSYLTYLRECSGKSEASIDEAAKALSRFEESTGYRDFRVFKREQATSFKRRLAEQLNLATGQPLAKATQNSTLKALRRFFIWLHGEPGPKVRFSLNDVDFFNLNAKDVRVATARRSRPVASLEEIKQVIAAMPSTSEIERRNKAVVAFAILTGARDGAIASLKLKHVDLDQDVIEQDAREVKTKASKTMTTWFFPVGKEVRQVVAEWVEYLRNEKLWGPDDPLFPATKIEQDADRLFTAKGLARSNWSTASPIREIFKEAFGRVGLRYSNPHTFRNTLARVGQQMPLTPEELKAWSQNLGHEKVLTTLTSYGHVEPQRQAEILRKLRSPVPPNQDELARRILAAVSREFGNPP